MVKTAAAITPAGPELWRAAAADGSISRREHDGQDTTLTQHVSSPARVQTIYAQFLYNFVPFEPACRKLGLDLNLRHQVKSKPLQH